MTIGLVVPHPLTPEDGYLFSSSPASRRSAPRTKQNSAEECMSAPASKPKTVGAGAVGATCLRCGGCQASGLYGQDEHCYGVLVHAFLTRHERCGNAVTITRFGR